MRAKKKMISSPQIALSVSKILAGSPSDSATVRHLLKEMCEQLDCAVGSFWWRDEETELLHCDEFYSVAACPKFESVTRELRLKQGADLPGLVWQNSSPLWLSDVGSDSNFSRVEQAKADRLCSALAFPISVEGRFIGVLEFFGDEIAEPDKDFFDMMFVVAGEFGQFVERKRLERELAEQANLRRKFEDKLFATQRHQQAADQRVSGFYMAVSHDLRTPLTSIKGALLLIERRHSETLSDTAKQLTLLARKECDRLVVLINNMLDIKRLEAGVLELHLEDLEPRAIVNETEALLSGAAADKEVELEYDCNTDSRVHADKDRIVQVLTNMVSNAVKFSQARSKVVVRVDDNNSAVRFSIIDCGCGISDQSRSKLNILFEQTGNQYFREGSGLGLAICKGIVVNHCGQIGFESKEGNGATFWFELPKV